MPSNPGNLIVVSAPSGAGKTSLVHGLLRRVPNIAASVSHTTRPQRDGERDGEDYFFVDKNSFDHMVEAGDFLEHAVVFGNCYGTSARQIDSRLGAGEDLVLEIDWQGARSVLEIYPEAVSIFVLPPSQTALRERLVARARDDSAVIEQRMQAAISEMSHYDEYEYLIINDDFETALDELCRIVLACRLKTRCRRATLGEFLRGLVAS